MAEDLNINKDNLLSRSGDRLARGILAEMLLRYGGLSGKAAAELMGGVHYSTVSQLRRRLKARMAKDKKTAKLYQAVESELSASLSNVKI